MLAIKLLGQFSVQVGGTPTEVGSRPAQALLAYLALNAGRPVRRERLAGLLWPESDESAARRNLRQALWQVRKGLGPAAASVAAGDLEVTLQPGADCWLDTAVLDAAGTEPATEALLAALAAYGGELLPGFYDEWVVLERDRLQGVYDQALRLLLNQLAAARRWEEALHWAERWLAGGATPEPAFRALMLAHAGLGDLAGMAAAYQRCGEALARELGVEPSEQTRRLYERLKRGEPVGETPGEPPVDAAPATQPPAEAAPPVEATAADAPEPGTPPFKGLHYFDEADEGLYFGREALVARLAGQLRDNAFLAVVGASGSGKSSLVRAGLLPALRRGTALAGGVQPPEGSAQWLIHVLTPTAQPLEALAASLTRAAGSVTATATLLDDLAGEARSLHLYAQRLLAGGAAKRLLLVIDQFEEVFTLCRSAEARAAFIDNLLAAVSPATNGPVSVVVTLRADFYVHCAQYTGLRRLLAGHQEYIGPMSRAELRRAMEAPAQQGGWVFEPGLVDQLLRAVGDEPGALPLLSHALLETWERRKGRTLTHSGYSAAGGVQGAIAHTAEGVYQRLTLGQQPVARAIFLRLTELGEGTQDTRRRAALSELTGGAEPAGVVAVVLLRLAEARLVTVSERVVEVAHEALIREWPTLREWLYEHREGLRQHRHLTEAAQAWQALAREPGELYRGARLAQALEWAAAHPGQANALENEFLAAAQAEQERHAAEREAQRQRELEAARRLAEARAESARVQAAAARRLRVRAVWLTVALVVAVVLAVAALWAAVQAQGQSRTAVARELPVAAVSNLGADADHSGPLALAVVGTTA